MSNEQVTPTITNNTTAQRWEAQIGQQRAIAAYKRDGDTLMFTHTEVPPELEGHGIASQLIKTALDDARAQHQTIIPLCPFVAGYIQRHPDYVDLVRSDFRHLIEHR